MSSPTTRKREPRGRPPSHQPSAVRSAVNPPRKSHAFTMFRAASSPGRGARRGPRPSGFVVGLWVRVGQAAGRPVGVRCVTAARAMKRRDVLERNEDVPVQLDVRHVLHVAIGRQATLLVVASEEGDLNLLALVLARVVLHGAEGSDSRSSKPSSAQYVLRSGVTGPVVTFFST